MAIRRDRIVPSCRWQFLTNDSAVEVKSADAAMTVILDGE